MTESGYWASLNRRRFGRRTLLRGSALGAAGLAGAALIGCGGDDETPSTGSGGGGGGGSTAAPGASGTAAASSNGAPANVIRAEGFSPDLGYGSSPVNEKEVQRGGTLRVPVTATNGESGDPETTFGSGVHGFISDKLFIANGWTAEIKPDLLESYEVTDSQGLEILLTLRPGIKTSNRAPTSGRDFNAEDVAWNIMRKAGKLDPEQAKTFLRVGMLAGLDRAEAVDDRTVKITLNSPNGSILNAFTHPGQAFIPVENEDIGFEPEKRMEWVGTGAWNLTEFIDGTREVYTANPDYYRQWDEGGRPGFDKMERTVVADRSSMIAGFITGEFDYMLSTAPHEVPQIESSVPGALWYQQLNNGWWYTGVNPHLPNQPAFADQRVWRAFQLSVDHKTLGDGHSGAGNWLYTGPVPSLFPEAMPQDEIKAYAGYNPDTKEQDIAEAKSLFEAAGYPNGAGISFSHNMAAASGASFDLGVRLADQWNKVFPDMEVTLVPHSPSVTFTNLQVTRQYESRCWQYASVPDAALEVRTYFHSAGGRNYEGFSQPWADEPIDKMIQALTREERIEAIRPFEKRMLEEGTPLLPLYVTMDKNVFQDTIGGADLVSGSFAHVSYGGGPRWLWRTA